MIAFTCPTCGAGWRSKPEFAGQAVKCARCGTAIRIPSPQATALSIPSSPEEPPQPGDRCVVCGRPVPPNFGKPFKCACGTIIIRSIEDDDVETPEPPRNRRRPVTEPSSSLVVLDLIGRGMSVI